MFSFCNRCYSYVGRRGNAQTVSLARSGCVYHKTVQHELLHALGFNHEQTRNDRDNHIRVGWENIQSGTTTGVLLLVNTLIWCTSML